MTAPNTPYEQAVNLTQAAHVLRMNHFPFLARACDQAAEHYRQAGLRK